MERLPALVTTAAFVGLLAGASAAQNPPDKPPDAETHKSWMNDAGDAQEDLREALAAKDGKAAATAALKIEGLMAQTEKYWAARHAEDIVKLAQTSRTLSRSVATEAGADKIDAAKEALQKLSANCNACHDLHPEKR
jgi:hypothetical protein